MNHMGLQGFVGISFSLFLWLFLPQPHSLSWKEMICKVIGERLFHRCISHRHCLCSLPLHERSLARKCSSLSAIRYIGSTSLTTVRYIDWFITASSDNLILCHTSCSWLSKHLAIWRLLIASILMLIFGFIGEGFIFWYSMLLGIIAWLYIIYELFFGEVHKSMEQANNPASTLAISGLKWIVSIGWSIYPIGYFWYDGHQSTGILYLNLTYKLADFVNKIAFGLVIWAAARKACQLNIKRSNNV